MVDINSKINRDGEKFHRKNSLEALKLVMKNFPNIRGIALVPSEHHAKVADGLCISIEVDVHELNHDERNTLKELGVIVPFINRLGDEIEIERINFDKEDIKKLKSITE